MKALIIRTPIYNLYVQSFTEWLQTLGYSPSSVYGMPNMLREYLYYLEQNKITNLRNAKQLKKIKQISENYVNYLMQRKNQRREGGLGIAHINWHIGVINRFVEYLRHTHRIILSLTLNRKEKEQKKDQIILSVEEIKKLYETTDETALGMRDRAMLSIYYGCGLRKAEGIALEINDVLFERKLIHIRKSKNNEERFVPVTTNHLQYLEQYIYNARPLLLGEESREVKLFINKTGEPIGKYMMYVRLKQLVAKAKLSKEIGLHTLRHSIATHLLQAGVEMEQIALFLGHKSLDSTQIYTHIINENTIKL